MKAAQVAGLSEQLPQSLMKKGVLSCPFKVAFAPKIAAMVKLKVKSADICNGCALMLSLKEVGEHM